MGWRPADFWSATPFEVSCAYIGHCKTNGKGRWAIHSDGWSDAEIEEFREASDAWLATLPKVTYADGSPVDG